MNESESIFNWMDENKDFFKPQGICKKVGIDKGNFSKYRKEKYIPEKYIKPIIDLITPLGFNKVIKIKDLTKPTNVIEPIDAEHPKTNFTINTKTDNKSGEDFVKSLLAEIELNKQSKK